MMRQLEAELPDDVSELRTFAVELLLANQLFQDRCKEALYVVLEEKHQAWNRCMLLEVTLPRRTIHVSP
jgi:tryptophan 2,3-dioxygenase